MSYLEKKNKKKHNYLMGLDGNYKFVVMDKDDTSEQYAKVQKEFAKELNKENEWVYIDMYRLHENQKFDGVYYQEYYSSDGVAFTLLQSPNIDDKTLNNVIKKFQTQRDAVGFEVIKYNINNTLNTFIDDSEKMEDFKKLSKEDFLKSYSYLTEQEYDTTGLLFDETKKVFTLEEIIDNDPLGLLQDEYAEQLNVKEKILKEISDHIEIEDIEMVACGDSWVNGDDASINIYCDMDAEDQELLKVVSYPHINGVTNYSDINGKFEIKKSELTEELEKNIRLKAVETFNTECEAKQDVEEKLTLK